jgi:hypothetical protein
MIVILSILDTEWPAIVITALLGSLFILIRSWRQKRR